MIRNQLSTIALLAMSGMAFSGTMGPVCTNSKVALACSDLGWDLAVQALYLQPTFGDDLRFIGAISTDSTQTHVANSPKWSWGFKLEAGYHLNPASDLNLNWYHFDGDRTAFSSTLVFLPGTTEGINDITVKPQWDAVNLEYGKLLNLGESKHIRLHGGAQYTYIKTRISEIGSFLDIDYTAFLASKFQGIGPRIGADLGYNVLPNTMIYAKSASAMLVGKTSFDNSYNRAGSIDRSSFLNKTVIVPEVEAKLGLNYTHNLTHSVLTLDAGYLWINYFGAQNTFYDYDPDNDFSLQGPYLGLKWVGVNI